MHTAVIILSTWSLKKQWAFFCTANYFSFVKAIFVKAWLLQAFTSKTNCLPRAKGPSRNVKISLTIFFYKIFPKRCHWSFGKRAKMPQSKKEKFLDQIQEQELKLLAFFNIILWLCKNNYCKQGCTIILPFCMQTEQKRSRAKKVFH